ncbi:hypothetical protein LTR62_005190 [Meristemomyces frigidus]|uniref:Transcription factor domain-containing protein n=1 Tax=Meristemomyces frigidus TaxID=1508187 RepID=A0AAN7TLB5_9PEZI|nr:hypothetical protein LTR62_005190 [Meristemomyces frigidus]
MTKGPTPLTPTSSSNGPPGPEIVPSFTDLRAPRDVSAQIARPNDLVRRSQSLQGSESMAPWPSPQTATTDSGAGDEERILMIAEILDGLRHFEMMRQSLRKYCLETKASSTPSWLIVSGVETLETLAGSHQPGSLRTIDYARRVLELSKRPLVITSSTTPAEFASMYSGPNLRLDYLGIVCAIAGRSYIYEESECGINDDFVQTMYRYSAICRRLSRDVSPMTDVMTWHALEHMLFSSHVIGDKSEEVWRGIGDLSSDILTLGYHKEASVTKDAPFFLAETRRRTYMKTYCLDMAVSSLFDRPLRLSRRFSDIQLPLDLPDAAVTAPPDELGAAREHLSPDGWNTTGAYNPASFLRMRVITAQIKEEILEHTFALSTPQSRERLRALSARNQESWASYPWHLRYTSTCWSSGLSGKICQMIMIAYLGYATIDFHIYRALERGDPTATTPLIKVSYDVVTMLIELGESRRREPRSHRDYSYLILLHGIPAAIVLVEALQKLTRTHQPSTARPFSGLPPTLTRSNLIRSLAVFLSQLDSASEPRDTNHAVCMQASGLLAGALDEVLEGEMGESAAAGGQTLGVGRDGNEAGMAVRGAVAAMPSSSSKGEMAGEGVGEQTIWNDSDLANWINTVDWSSLGADWGTF